MMSAKMDRPLPNQDAFSQVSSMHPHDEIIVDQLQLLLDEDEYNEIDKNPWIGPIPEQIGMGLEYNAENKEEHITKGEEKLREKRSEFLKSISHLIEASSATKNLTGITIHAARSLGDMAHKQPTVTKQVRNRSEILEKFQAKCSPVDLRNIAAACLEGKFSDNTRQFISVWGNTINDWASCKNGRNLDCPCCYLCRLPIVSKEVYGGQPEMEHVIACMLAFSNFPNMDILRYYYPFILRPNAGSIDKNGSVIGVSNWDKDYQTNTNDRIYTHTEGFGADDNASQSLRATPQERAALTGYSMYNYWQNFLQHTHHINVMKELYKAINCGIGDEAEVIERVKKLFKAFILGTNTSCISKNLDGAFERIFEYCFDIILVWLYEFAYSHRLCNQRKADLSLDVWASNVTLSNGDNDALTGDRPKTYIDTTDRFVIAERKHATGIDKAFKDNLENEKTFRRANNVNTRYKNAAESFKRVSIQYFDPTEVGTREVYSVFNTMNLARIFKFTDLSNLCGLSLKGSSTSGKSNAVVVNPDAEKKQQVDSLKKQIDDSNKAISGAAAKIHRINKDIDQYTKELKIYNDIQNNPKNDKGTDAYARRANTIKLYRDKIQAATFDIQSTQCNIDGMRGELGKKRDVYNDLISPKEIHTPTRTYNDNVTKYTSKVTAPTEAIAAMHAFTKDGDVSKLKLGEHKLPTTYNILYMETLIEQFNRNGYYKENSPLGFMEETVDVMKGEKRKHDTNEAEATLQAEAEAEALANELIAEEEKEEKEEEKGKSASKRRKGKGKGKGKRGGTRRKRIPNKSNRTRKGRRKRTQSNPKRTRRVRKSSRKKKTRRRVKK
jgi:hypothetical protein